MFKKYVKKKKKTLKNLQNKNQNSSKKSKKLKLEHEILRINHKILQGACAAGRADTRSVSSASIEYRHIALC